jgi:hypothetical protein
MCKGPPSWPRESRVQPAQPKSLRASGALWIRLWDGTECLHAPSSAWQPLGLPQWWTIVRLQPPGGSDACTLPGIVQSSPSSDNAPWPGSCLHLPTRPYCHDIPACQPLRPRLLPLSSGVWPLKGSPSPSAPHRNPRPSRRPRRLHRMQPPPRLPLDQTVVFQLLQPLQQHSGLKSGTVLTGHRCAPSSVQNRL